MLDATSTKLPVIAVVNVRTLGVRSKRAMKNGTSTGGIETSARYRRKQRKRRTAENEAWAAQSGPTVIRIGDHEIYVKSQAKKDIAAARKLLIDAIAAGAPPGTVRPRT